MKKNLLLIVLGWFIFLNERVQTTEDIPRSNQNIKVLVLIIASDDLPVYLELQKIWKQYMHLDPDHIEAYFIRGNPNLINEYEIHEDIIWSKTAESLVPGIIRKTILSMEAMQSRLKDFDYILRTNLSCFYVFPRLLEYLKNSPRTNFYGATYLEEGIGGGSYLLSPDVVEFLIQNKNYFLNDHSNAPDDLLLGGFLKANKIPLVIHQRKDFLTAHDWNVGKYNIPNNIFWFRIKNLYPYLRLTEDIYIHRELLRMFYNK